MRAYISTKHRHIVLAPCKTGSCTVDNMLKSHPSWDSIFLGKKIHDTKNFLYDYLCKDIYKEYTKILLIRNPIDWIISGFRYMQLDVNKKQGYPKVLREHLVAVLKNEISCEYWIHHCYWQPLSFFNDDYITFKIENFDKFVEYLEKNCQGEFIKHKIYQFNKNIEIPYPTVDNIDISLLLKIAKTYNDIGQYNLNKTINNYVIKHGVK